MSSIHENVQEYYTEQLQQSNDLKTDACCLKAKVPCFIKSIIEKIHPDVLSKYFGCGLVFPPKLEACRVLDLGSGSGRDVYILSSLVGPNGYVVGVDMTPAQVAIAERFVDYHTKEFGFEQANVEFILGKIEELTDNSRLKPNSFDVVISNCVVNLTPNKRKVLEQVYAMLKPGGEFYFSDMYADRPIPEELRNNKILWGEGLSGALMEDELIVTALDIGFTRPCLVSKTSIDVKNDELKRLVGDTNYFSCTYRLFKDTTNVESQSGALVTYQSPIIHFEDKFQFDHSITFQLHEPSQYLNAEMTKMLCISRYRNHFKFEFVADNNE